MVKTVITLHLRHILKSYSNLRLCTSFWDTLMPLIILEMAGGCEQTRLWLLWHLITECTITYWLWVTKRESSRCLDSTRCPRHSHPIYSRHLEQCVGIKIQQCYSKTEVQRSKSPMAGRIKHMHTWSTFIDQCSEVRFWVLSWRGSGGHKEVNKDRMTEVYSSWQLNARYSKCNQTFAVE